MHSFVTSKNAQWPRLIWPTLYVCLSVCDVKAVFHTSSNTSKIISRLNSIRQMLRLTPTWTIWSNRNTPQFRVE